MQAKCSANTYLSKEQVAKIKNIKMVLFDIDGVLTDGSVYLNDKGEEMLKFSRIDGKGIELLKNNAYILGVISAENSEIVKKRMNKLGISELNLGIADKTGVYNKLKQKYNLKDDKICFCGDDVQDIAVLEKVGFSCCPANAQNKVKKACDYISDKNGGNGFVRDVCNKILDLDNK